MLDSILEGESSSRIRSVESTQDLQERPEARIVSMEEIDGRNFEMVVSRRQAHSLTVVNEPDLGKP